ncbi:hypothetical protein M0802_001795 [Mischocyttarus mexicanus]|nr:hypothetical protein M0802_001795 [Mischocyttarus mexicanus]
MAGPGTSRALFNPLLPQTPPLPLPLPPPASLFQKSLSAIRAHTGDRDDRATGRPVGRSASSRRNVSWEACGPERSHRPGACLPACLLACLSWLVACGLLAA